MARFDDITIKTNVDSSTVQVGGIQVSNGFSSRSVIAEGNKAKAYTCMGTSLVFEKWQLTTKRTFSPPALGSGCVLVTLHLRRYNTTNWGSKLLQLLACGGPREISHEYRTGHILLET